MTKTFTYKIEYVPHGCGHITANHTIDHEVGPCKMAFLHGPTSWSNYGLIDDIINLQSLWAPH